jgi:hypothetical protein
MAQAEAAVRTRLRGKTVISQKVKDLAASKGQTVPDNLPTHRSGVAAAGDASEALSSGEERSDSSSESENSDHRRFIATDIESSDDGSRRHLESLNDADFRKLQTIQEEKRPAKRPNDDVDVKISRPNKRHKPPGSDEELSPLPPASAPETNSAGVNIESIDSSGHTSETLPQGNPVNSQNFADDYGFGYITKEQMNSVQDDPILFDAILKESEPESDEPFLNNDGVEIQFETDGLTDTGDNDDGLTDPELGEF